jgi:hypothetical protein
VTLPKTGLSPIGTSRPLGVKMQGQIEFSRKRVP